MFHIKNDKRSAKSAHLIYEGLLFCLQEKTLDKITITDIQQASFVSRSTFYRHFDSIADVLYWKCDCCFRQVLREYTPPADKASTYYHFMKYFLEYWVNNSQILEILLKINRVDIIFACHISNMPLLTEKIALNTATSIPNSKYFIGIRAGIMLGVLITWLENGKQETAEQVFAILQEQFDFIKSNDLFL